ncbi:MAG: GTP-binding protein [Sneathiella sp.]|nr:GTP-binding protein [Sneathiella sp.]
MSSEENRLRLTILGGFLGAGKSTWLRHQLFAKTYDQPHVIVNEVASHAVDDTLLKGARCLDVLAGGCVCCDQKEQMIALLHRICNDRSRKQDTPQTRQLVFEMSGVADPGQVLTAIQNDPILNRHIILEEIIVVVDALHGLEQLRTEPLSRRQIEAADQILITKTDSCDAQTLETLLATLRQVNPASERRASVFGVEEPLADASSAQPVQLPDLDGLTEEPLSSWSLNLDEYGTDENSWVGFSVWLSAMLHSHGNHMVRVKGVVRTPGGRLLLQSVRKVMQAPEMLPDLPASGERSSDNTIVLIGRGMNQERIHKSLHHVMTKTAN